jgi:hypothetical protein
VLLIELNDKSKNKLNPVAAYVFRKHRHNNYFFVRSRSQRGFKIKNQGDGAQINIKS